MNLNKLTTQFLLSLEASGDAPRTLATYRQRLRYFFDFVERCEPGEICPEMVESWIVAMRRRNLSDVTILGRFTAVKTFFTWLVARGFLAHSPLPDIRLRPPRCSCIKAAAAADVRQMIETAKIRAQAGNYRDIAMLLFLVETGCRSGELASLRLETLSLTKREALVSGKTGSRMVDFTTETAVVLDTWITHHPALETGCVFVSLRVPYRPIMPGTLYQMLRRLAAESGISGRYNPHSIRHLVGQIWADHTNLELTRQKLGHQNISTTAIYANQDRDRVKRFTDRLRIV